MGQFSEFTGVSTLSMHIPQLIPLRDGHSDGALVAPGARELWNLE
jgi:hypothetical protein